MAMWSKPRASSPRSKPWALSPRVKAWSLSPRLLALLCLAGWLVRLSCVGHGRAFWDEIYQFVEPAVWQLTGMGVRTWEYQEGMRNWLLPTYYGALLRVAQALGLRSLHTYVGLQIINTLWSLWMIPLTYRLGLAVSGGRTPVAWMSAVLVAFLAPIVFYSVTLLSELPAMIFMTWGWTLWYELMAGRARRPPSEVAACVGLLLGAAVVLRYSFVLGALPVVLELAWRRQWRTAMAMAMGAALPLAVLGAFDTVTWGTPWHSAWAYFHQNIVVGKAAKLFSKHPRSYYWDTMFRLHFRIGRLLLPLALLFVRRHPRAVFGFVLPLVGLCCIDHKEERFASFTWPLVLVACSHGWVLACDWLKAQAGVAGAWFYTQRHVATALVTAAVLVSSATHLRFVRYDADAHRAAAWAGAQADCAGFMSDADDGGGYFIFGRSVPIWRWHAPDLQRSDVTYVAAHTSAHRDAIARLGAYRVVKYEGRFALYRRLDTLGGPVSIGP